MHALLYWKGGEKFNQKAKTAPEKKKEGPGLPVRATVGSSMPWLQKGNFLGRGVKD